MTNHLRHASRLAVVLGGCGFIGSHVARHLLASGLNVTVVDRCEADALPAFVGEAAAAGKLTFVQAELGSVDIIEELVAQAGGADLVNCAAVLPGPRTPLDFIDTNGVAVWRICEMLRTSRAAGRFVHLSTRSIYGRYEPAEGPLDENTLPRPTDYYGASKAAGDLAIEVFRDRAGVDAVALRITGVFGALPGANLDRDHSGNPVMAMIAAASRGVPYVAQAGAEYRYEVTYVKDVVRGVMTLLSAAEPQHPVYNLSGADAQPSLADIAQSVRLIFSGLRCEYVDPQAAPVARAAMLGTRLQNEFGYRPAWPLARALPDYVDAIEHRHYGAPAA
jgi:nucleoside-diphosphate-sugar epimerase